MKELTYRSLATIFGWALVITGLIGIGDLFYSARTSLPPSSRALYGFGPGLIVVGAVVLLARRGLDPKRIPSPAGLIVVGLLVMAAPFLVWALGSAFAPNDDARWGTLIAVSLLLLAIPGLGMVYGGARNWSSWRHAPPPVRKPPAVKVRRKR